MPLYEYGCDACGHTLEIQQKLAEAPLKTCPSCGKDELHKIISATAFVLKGGGWYKDGYGSQRDKPRTENQRGDRVEKAVKEDKAKTEAAAGSSSAGSSAGSSSSATSGSGGSGDSGSNKSSAS